MVPKFLKANPKKIWLAIFSVALSVTLVTGIFSMLEVFLVTEKIQILNETGNYHLVVKDISVEEKVAISSRVDVKNAGEWISLNNGSIQGVDCRLAAVDEKIAKNMKADVVEGRFPTANNELMLERWAMESFNPPLQIGDAVTIHFAEGQERAFTISGLFTDIGNLKASATPGVILSMAAAREISTEKMSLFIVEFKERVNILHGGQSIKDSLTIADERIVYNEKLLAVMGQSQNKSALSLYLTGAVMFFIVLLAGVMMIYNTFNISVMERVRQFGLLRCIGASAAQIRQIVRREGLAIAIKAIPLGVLAGILITFACSALLKFYNSNLFGEMPLFRISPSGIAAGVVIGFVTMLIASFAPANKAASVSPVNAVTGSSELKMTRKQKNSLLTRLFHVEVALGINNAVSRKKTLFLMSCSIAISIILFLGFNVFIDFMYSSLKTTKPYTPDVSIASEAGLSQELYAQIDALEGTEKVYGRMFGYVEATFDAARLTRNYLDEVGPVTINADGTFIPPEKSWLISYDANQFNWAKRDLVAGSLDEAALNQGNGIVAVISNLRHSITNEPVDWRLGEKVRIETPNGPREMTVMAIIRKAPFSDSNLNMTTLITTEKLYTALTGDSTLRIIDIQLQADGQENTLNQIKSMLEAEVTFYDSRQKNAEIDQTFFSMAIFVYGFVIVIALISVLNIFNTMNTSIAAKTRYLGVMRAIGMAGVQLERMVLVEAATYCLSGCLAGIALGTLLQKMLTEDMLAFAHIPWRFPWEQIVLIVALTLISTGLSTINPLRHIKSRGISEVISSL
ncbi:MAG: ABC transporter permease [Chloroflexi bacterium HGW-Chloroflexi-10]|nr:MAG: ABC transporter permease [Chloroflexi bacterium HGW-Chloroflexi-10]